MLARPDPSTFQVLPWRGRGARDRADLLRHPAAGRVAVLRRPALRAQAGAGQGGGDWGSASTPTPRSSSSCSATAPSPGEVAGAHRRRRATSTTPPHGTGQDFRRQAITMLEAMGISVEFSHHEGAPGQQEIDLRYADALTTADNLMTFRMVMKEVALEQGVFASFMPKPFTEYPGSGMHTHLSLFEGDRNAFHESGAPYQLSKVGRSFIAGLLRHAPEFTAVTNQWVNSYKRLSGSDEAPTYICWGHNNRSALVRVPMYKPLKEQSTRVEIRSPDSACNPYLAFAVLLAAGLKGIEEGYELPEATEDNVWTLTDGERRALGIDPLPASLADAIAVMERSELVAETLGEHVFDFFLRNKRSEWQDYRRQVTAYERDRYLPSSDQPTGVTPPRGGGDGIASLAVEIGEGLLDHRAWLRSSHDRQRRWT